MQPVVCSVLSSASASCLRSGPRNAWRWLAALTILLTASSVARGQEEEAGPPEEPVVASASDEGRQAIAGFQVPESWETGLFAAEPLVANPVAFFIDPHGRVFVCESFRQNRGVTDNRGHDQAWLDDDLAAQTVEDRLAYHKKHLGASVREYTRYDDRIRLLVDRDSDGQADEATVFAKHFNQVVDGTGAGVLYRKGDVYYTCIPHLWLLRDEDGDGESEVRRSLHYGFGVRVAFRGHDMHGLILGPDGRLYFSIGDRGYNVATPDGRLKNPESGAVFRCELDGSNLEVVATGLRNPQELAFDKYGNLFTGDNNSDSGDQARWVYLVEGSDSGWRMSYQYLPDRGPFNREKIWHPFHAETPAYIVPPIANLADGPSGLAYYPGTGLSDHYNGRFFLCDFRGGPANSGIRTFRVEPKGAFFEVADAEQTLWKILATDVAFGPDGGVYVSDWVNGWNGEGKGRIYRFVDNEAASSDAARQVQQLLAEGFEGRPIGELAGLLAHQDQRVRLEAQFELARRNETEALIAVARDDRQDQLARLHAIWGLGQIARHSPGETAADVMLDLEEDADPEVRAQASKVLGDARHVEAFDALVGRLADENLRVRAFAAEALGKLGREEAVPHLLNLLAVNDGSDPIIRHTAIVALSRVGSAEDLADAAKHASRAARVGAAVALRRQASPLVARFLRDGDAQVVLEAARAIHDVPIPEAQEALANLIHGASQSDPLMRRVLNANFRLGTQHHADSVARYAARSGGSETLRLEALNMLRDWSSPSNRDRVLGMWRPLEPRDADVAVSALRPALPGILTGPDAVRNAGAKIAAELGITEVAPTLYKLVDDGEQPAQVRADALDALLVLKHADVLATARQAVNDPAGEVRAAARRVLAQLAPDEAVEELRKALVRDEKVDRQAAFATLADMEDPAADRLIENALDSALRGDADPVVLLDILMAAEQRSTPTIKTLLGKYHALRPADDPTAPYRETLEGGDAERGRRIFFERTEVSCVRCHKVEGRGGEVGPDLTTIARDKGRQYLLEAIVTPSKAIAKGYETLMIADADGVIHSGIVKNQDDESIELVTAEGALVTILKDDIEQMRQGKSAMPEDLIKQLNLYDLRDVIEFLAQRATGPPAGE